MSDIIKSVRDFYDEAGSHFSRTRQKTYGGSSSNWPVTDKYLSGLKAGQSVLDIGCGNGKLVSGLPTGVEYRGVDFSRTLISEAKRLHPNYAFEYGDIADPSTWITIPVCEAIFCVAVLHHIPEFSQQLFVLKQAKRHLKKDGFLYLTVWNLWQAKFAQYQVNDHFEVPYRQDLPTGRQEWRRYCVPYDIQSMSDLMSKAGLEISEMFFADRESGIADIISGENLVVVAS